MFLNNFPYKFGLEGLPDFSLKCCPLIYSLIFSLNISLNIFLKIGVSGFFGRLQLLTGGSQTCFTN